MRDWSEEHVKLYPLARDLNEAMNMRDWAKAEELSRKMLDAVLYIHSYSVMKQEMGNE